MSKGILLLPIIGVLTLNATIVASASAETPLLGEWLANGTAITSLLPIQITTEVDIGIPPVVIKCSFTFDGSVGPDGEREFIGLLALTGVQVGLAAVQKCESLSGCETGTDIQASPENLPWHGTLKLMESGSFLDEAESATFWVSCLVFGISTSQECTEIKAGTEAKNVAGGVEFVGSATPLANCTTSGTETGEITFLSGNLMSLTEGGTLSVSSL